MDATSDKRKGPKLMSQFQNLKYLTIYQELQKKIREGEYGPGDKLPTETTLANQFGVSRPTVTRALNALKEEGLIYRITGSGSFVSSREDSLGVALNRMVGLIVPGLGKNGIFEPICAKIAEQSGPARFSLIWGGGTMSSNEVYAPEELTNLAEKYCHHKVSAVIFTPLECHDTSPEINKQILSILDNANIPVILLDSDYTPFPHRSSYDLVSVDHYLAAYQITMIYINQNAERVDFLYRPRSASSMNIRLQGYRSALINSGITPEPAWEHTVQPEDTEKINGILKDKRAQNFICGNDETAASLLKTLTALGKRVPDDVRICGFDDTKFGGMLKSALTTYHQPCEEIGEEIVRILLSRLKNPGGTPRTVTIKGYPVLRESSQIPSQINE